VAKHISAQFDNMHDRLDALDKKTDRIETQTTKTNGRVTELEREVHNELPHTAEGCPQKDVIENIYKIVISDEAIKSNEEKMQSYYHSDRVRVIMLIGIFASMIMSAIGIIYGRKNHDATTGLKTEVDMINTPVRTRDGSIMWYPSGVIIDSLKTK
jgi:hypothetical protein